ncbi:MAG: DUF1513 domain-containing protein [Cocleimonas sp.]|nr:DUF1513 domain-containing protein [Cocleimonas sp.]
MKTMPLKTEISCNQTRRQLLKLLLVTGVFPTLVGCQQESKRREILLGAQGSDADRYSMSWLHEGESKANIALSGFRGHGASQHPLYPASAIMYGRRPATRSIEVNLETQHITKTFHCAPNRHFFGHGCFSKAGDVLYTTEADLKTGNGKIGIRDARTYQQIGEHESYGIGPHELALMPDAKTLVVANGGILTRPESGRKKLNLDSMASSLSYIDLESGKLLGAFKVAETKASIRHLDVASDGTVAFAMQLQRSATEHDDIVPLGGIHAKNKAIKLLEKPENLIHKMKDYMGSVAINQQTRTAGFTSPRGNVVAFWDIDTQQFKGYHELRDVCGIALANNKKDFVISNSFGQLRYLNGSTLKEDKTQRIMQGNLRWDNHLIMAEVRV